MADQCIDYNDLAFVVSNQRYTYPATVCINGWNTSLLLHLLTV